MQDRYLLYIDMLGFKDLVFGPPDLIPALYEIVDSLNVHAHHSFKTIVFSDTIVVYSIDNMLQTEHDHEYAVMYSCEFAQDLMYRLIGTGFSFRGVLTYGRFDHYHLKHTECFYGEALVNAYLREKDIKCTGLFIDEASNSRNKIFKTNKHNEDLSYVHLNQHTEEIVHYAERGLPIKDSFHIEQGGIPYRFLRDVLLLKEMYDNANTYSEASVGLKYQTAWNYQQQRMPELLPLLVRSRFDPNAIALMNWQPVYETVHRNLHPLGKSRFPKVLPL